MDRRAALRSCLGAALAPAGARLSHLLGSPPPAGPRFVPLKEAVLFRASALRQLWKATRFSARCSMPGGGNGEVRLEGIVLRVPAGRKAATEERFKAFCLLCPHEDCPLDYGTDSAGQARIRAGGPVLFCPCHFSTFDLRAGGAVLGGPAPRGA